MVNLTTFFAATVVPNTVAGALAGLGVFENNTNQTTNTSLNTSDNTDSNNLMPLYSLVALPFILLGVVILIKKMNSNQPMLNSCKGCCDGGCGSCTSELVKFRCC